MSSRRPQLTRPGRRRRGEPLVVLAMVLGGWVTVRAALWEDLPLAPMMALRESVALARPKPAATPARLLAASLPAPVRVVAVAPAPVTVPPLAQAPSPPLLLAAPPAPPVVAGPAPVPPGPVHLASAHALLWMAAVNGLPLPEVFATARPAAGPVAAPAPRRWSGDGWLLARAGGAGFSPAGGLPTYGASQLGAVLRYRLDGGNSGHRATAYLRFSGALGGTGTALAEREAALGLSARPLAALPLRASVEVRATRFAGGATRLRPAAGVVSELAPITLPLATRAEFYAQAGYVGGPAATAFVDGQLRIDRRIARLGAAELRGGGGLWGGAQAGAGRLDMGPGLTLGGPVGATRARLAMDWRFRLVGNAAPASGPALTLSAGF